MDINLETTDKIPFTDPYMFSLVMQNKEICLGLLRLILPGENFTEIRQNEIPFNDQAIISIQTESAHKFAKDSHGVRFDAFAKSENTWAEVEMQTTANVHIGKRSRYYQGNMDIEALNKGTSYDKLPKAYVIFICTFDYLGANQPLYFFRTLDEKNNLPLDDESFKIIVNTSCEPENVPRDLRPLFDYINNRINEVNDNLIIQIEHEVLKYSGSEWRWRFVTFEDELKLKYESGLEEGRAAGLSEGHAVGLSEGRREGSFDTLSKLYKEGLLTLEQASLNAGMSGEAFLSKLNKLS